MNSIVQASVIVAVFIASSSDAQTSFQCGVPRPGVNRLMVRGSDADPLDWPWHAIILHKTLNKGPPKYACGGTLIHKNFIITAKHCLLDEETGDLLSEKAIVVRLGIRVMYQTIQGVQESNVFAIHTFEDEEKDKELYNDVAILELRTSVMFNNHVLPACLIDRRMTPGDYGTVIGFGLTEAGTTSSVLKMAEMSVIDPLRCVRSDRTGFGGTLHEGHFCAGFQNGTTVCNRDSGGGFFLKQNRAWHLAGIVSFSQANEAGHNRCRHDNYGALTMVFKYLEWIRRVTGLTGELLTASGLAAEEPQTGLTGINPPATVKPQKKRTGPKCGKRNPAGIGNNRYSSDSIAQYVEFPWMIRVSLVSDTQNRYICEGSLIHPRVVLTMAKEVYYKKHTELKVRGGEFNAENIDEPHLLQLLYRELRLSFLQDSNVTEIIVHPQYEYLRFPNDIALLFLTIPFYLKEAIQTVCLPPPGTTFDHQRCISSGWKRQELGKPDKYHNIIEKVEHPIVPFAQCQEKIKNYSNDDSFNLHNSSICAGGDRLIWVGYNGSPLVCPIQGSQDHYYQVGVLALRFGADNVPVVYTPVAHYRTWIDEQMQARQLDTHSYSYQ